ncbi:class I SAM-dependent methyltransferase [Micromonospora sp. SL1-18]|uniref:class I SAM-dependent methyltransferase n=1 Tax=Micromonospora sp. SL1-18 TaxID=3399128 RepID=UPI003A4D6CC3
MAGLGKGIRMADESFDHVVSVNNVVFWDDIPAGFAELRRALRPGGTAVVAFHSGAGRSRRARRIGLTEDAAVRLQADMGAVFGPVTRHDLTHLVAFSAVCGAW